MALRTAPQIQFDPLSTAQALSSLLDDFKINDCDQPKAPQLRLRSVSDCEINIKYGLNQFDLDGPRTVDRIVVEYGILDDCSTVLRYCRTAPLTPTTTLHSKHPITPSPITRHTLHTDTPSTRHHTTATIPTP